MEFKLSIHKTSTDNFLLINGYTNKVVGYFDDYESSIKYYRYLKEKFLKIPKELLILMCSEQVIQSNTYDPIIFARNINIERNSGGFNLGDSILGYDFWEKVLNQCEYHHAVKLYNEVLKLNIANEL